MWNCSDANGQVRGKLYANVISYIALFIGNARGGVFVYRHGDVIGGVNFFKWKFRVMSRYSDEGSTSFEYIHEKI